jgi:small subunit ribosomal protein S6e
MKINIAYPRNGTCKQFEVAEEQFRKGGSHGKRLGAEIDGAAFGEQFKGYIFRLKGGQDTQGFPMVCGVAAAARVSLLLKRGATGFAAFRGRAGERRRKAIRGDIVAADCAVLELTVVKTGDKPIEGVTDVVAPRRLGPKRANKIRKLFNLSEDDDVRKFVVKRKVTKAGKKDRFKAPRIQRLITPTVKARRAKKVTVRKEALKSSAVERRAWLSTVAKDRMKQRQRKAAAINRKKVAAAKVAKK